MKRDDKELESDDTQWAPSGVQNVPLSGAAQQTVPAAANEDGPPRVGGRYDIIELIGVGGMGSVYRARDVTLDELVALKVLRREIVGRAALDRFKSEVRLGRRVTHPNVARVFDIGEFEHETYLTMELVDGESLAALLAREGRLPLARALSIIHAICAGLTAAHAAGVVHRDLKPENVLLSCAGRVVVTDFGIARDVGGPSGDVTVGGMVGTPAYMAPEQVEGAHELDARVDIYALGATMFELFTGERAWRGSSPIAIAAARLAAEPPDPRTLRPDLSDALANIVLRCMARRREDRYPDIEAVVGELAAVTPAETPMTMRPPAPRAAVSDPSIWVRAKTVAVLPLDCTGAADAQDLVDGLSEDLIDTLSMLGLRVRPSAAVQSYRGPGVDPREAGKQLDVQVVVTGAVRKVGERLRISARLASVAEGFQLWAKRFDCSEAEALVVSEEIARAIADALAVPVSAPVRAAVADRKVIELYLQARKETRLFAVPTRAIEWLEQALTMAPGDPTILAALATARARAWHLTGAGREAALAASEHAVAVAPHLGDARHALGLCLLYAGLPVRAMREAREALRLAPGYAPAHQLVGRMLLEAGNPEAGIRRLEASANLEPDAEAVYQDLWRGYDMLGAPERAAESLARAAVNIGDQRARFALARRAMWRGDAETLRAATIAPAPAPVGPVMALVASGVATVEEVHAASPLMHRSKLDETPRRRGFHHQMCAEMLMYFGHHEAAMQSVADAAASCVFDVSWFDHCPLLEPLRAQPRFAEVRSGVAALAAQILQAYAEPLAK